MATKNPVPEVIKDIAETEAALRHEALRIIAQIIKHPPKLPEPPKLPKPPAPR